MLSRAKITNNRHPSEIQKSSPNKYTCNWFNDPIPLNLSNRIFSFSEQQQQTFNLPNQTKQTDKLHCQIDQFCAQLQLVNQIIDIDPQKLQVCNLTKILMFNTWDKITVQQTLIQQRNISQVQLNKQVCDRMLKYLRIFDHLQSSNIDKQQGSPIRKFECDQISFKNEDYKIVLDQSTQPKNRIKYNMQNDRQTNTKKIEQIRRSHKNNYYRQDHGYLVNQQQSMTQKQGIYTLPNKIKNGYQDELYKSHSRNVIGQNQKVIRKCQKQSDNKSIANKTKNPNQRCNTSSKSKFTHKIQVKRIDPNKSVKKEDRKLSQKSNIDKSNTSNKNIANNKITKKPQKYTISKQNIATNKSNTNTKNIITKNINSTTRSINKSDRSSSIKSSRLKTQFNHNSNIKTQRLSVDRNSMANSRYSTIRTQYQNHNSPSKQHKRCQQRQYGSIAIQTFQKSKCFLNMLKLVSAQNQNQSR